MIRLLILTAFILKGSVFTYDSPGFGKVCGYIGIRHCGPRVWHVCPNSPAYFAGMRDGDRLEVFNEGTASFHEHPLAGTVCHIKFHHKNSSEEIEGYPTALPWDYIDWDSPSASEKPPDSSSGN